MWSYNYLCHYGIPGQKWGVRRYQNPDGTYTEEGKQRYGRVTSENVEDHLTNIYKQFIASYNYGESNASKKFKETSMKEVFKAEKEARRLISDIRNRPNSKYSKSQSASKEYVNARHRNVSEKEQKRLLDKAEKLQKASDNEDLYVMYKYVTKSYPKEYVPFMLANIYGLWVADERDYSDWAYKLSKNP